MQWKELQKEVAELFRSVGCFANEDQKVTGVRGEHKVDVYVIFKALSVECSWIVECKHWNTNVTKEKVLALQSIVQDVGADKGVLVAKKGRRLNKLRDRMSSDREPRSSENMAVGIMKWIKTRKSGDKVIVEFQEQRDVEVLVIRQRTTRTSGFHVKPEKAIEIFRLAYQLGQEINQALQSSNSIR